MNLLKFRDTSQRNFGKFIVEAESRSEQVAIYGMTIGISTFTRILLISYLIGHSMLLNLNSDRSNQRER